MTAVHLEDQHGRSVPFGVTNWLWLPAREATERGGSIGHLWVSCNACYAEHWQTILAGGKLHTVEPGPFFHATRRGECLLTNPRLHGGCPPITLPL